MNANIDDLRHIRFEINFLIEKSQGVSLERFLDDATLQRAFVRSIEVIGEAAWDVATKRIPELRDQISSILEVQLVLHRTAANVMMGGRW